MKFNSSLWKLARLANPEDCKPNLLPRMPNTVSPGDAKTLNTKLTPPRSQISVADFVAPRRGSLEAFAGLETSKVVF